MSPLGGWLGPFRIWSLYYVCRYSIGVVVDMCGLWWQQSIAKIGGAAGEA